MSAPFDHERSRNVARPIERIMVDANSREPKEIVRLLDECQEKLLSDSAGEFEATEIARRIAEAKISLLFDREGADDEFVASWESMESVGYTSLEREASMLFFQLKFCERARANDHSLAVGLLDRFRLLIDRMSASGDEDLASHFRAVHGRLENALNLRAPSS